MQQRGRAGSTGALSSTHPRWVTLRLQCIKASDLWSPGASRSRQVSCDLWQAGVGYVVLHVSVDCGQRGAEFAGCLRLVGRDEWGEEPVVDLGVEDGDPDAVVGEPVAVGSWLSADEPGQPQPSQVVGHLVGAVVAAEQPGDQDTQAFVGEAGRGEQRLAQGAGQGHDPRIAEPEGRGPATRRVDGGVRDPLKGWSREDAALTDPFSIQDSAVAGTGLDL